MTKIGRNSPCPCGNGKKYKKCCINKFKQDDLSRSIKVSSNFKNKTRNSFGKESENVIFYENNPNIPKMSEIILEFVDELLHNTRNEGEGKKAIMLGCAAWNIALIQDATKRQEAIEDLLKTLKISEKADIQDFCDTINYLIDKKLAEYNDVNRYIVNFEITENFGQLSLNIASTITSEQPNQE